jgi:PKD repeat protein
VTVLLGDLTVLPPDEVWVDDDWASQTDVDDDGYDLIWEYNAWNDIQDGVDAIEDDDPDNGGTVNVLEGSYTAFAITESDVEVIGIDDDVNVSGGATVTNTNSVTIENVEFSDTVSCLGTTDTYLTDLTVTGGSDGIYVNGAPTTVYIDNPEIYGVTNGIYVTNDTVYVTNPWIYNVTTGIYAASGSYVDVSGGLIESFSANGIYAASATVYVSNLEIANQSDSATGVYVGDYSYVEVSDCSRIHDNQYGFWVSTDGDLAANGNDIYSNSSYGVHWEGGSYTPDCVENWWGDEAGPNVGDSSMGDRDGIYYSSISYSPWLDAPCDEGGAPVGASARFAAAPRSGAPGTKVQFTDKSVGASSECPIVEWEWNFGDGSTSDEKNPSHVYMREGSFTIKLTVWDDCGFSSTTTMKAYVTIAERKDEDKVEPAKLGVSYLNIDPAQVLPNQEVVVSANICNSGEERGSKTVSLMLNGEAIDSQSVAVSGGACQQVIFKTSRAVPGTYQVAVDGMVGQFSVLAPRTVTNNVPSQQSTGLGTAGIIAIIAVLIVLIVALILVFRRD